MSIQDENNQNTMPDGDSGNSENGSKTPEYEKNFFHIRATRMASTFFFTALLGLLFRTVIFPFIFAPLSIFFAYIGKGKRKKNDWYNNLFIGFSVIILIVNLAYCGYIGYSFNHDTKFHRQLDDFSRQMYGMSFENYMEKVQESFNSPDGTVTLPMPTNDALNSLMNEGKTAPASGETDSSAGDTNTGETNEKNDSPPVTPGVPVADTDTMKIGGGYYEF